MPFHTLHVPRHIKVLTDLQSGSGVYHRVLEKWVKLYAGFTVRRFDRYSRGGGNWKKNSPLTIALKKSSAILVNTREMRLKLPFAIDAVAYTSTSVWVGFVSDLLHAPSALPLAELLTKHDKGLGTPKRQILDVPDDLLRSQIVSLALSTIARHARGEPT